MASNKTVLLFIDNDGIALIELNRPNARNAMSAQLDRELKHTIIQCENDDRVKCMVLTGKGKAFCAGVDLKEFAAGKGADPRAKSADLSNFKKGGLFAGRKKPLIGAINGPSVTGGLEMALNCDFLIASTKASFADTHARVGVMPGWGLTVILPQWIGVNRARQMSITGNYVFAKQALDWGLVNEVVEPEKLVPRAIELAKAVTTIDTNAVKHMLATYDNTTGGTIDDGFITEQKFKAQFKESDGKEVGNKFEGIRNRGATQQKAKL